MTKDVYNQGGGEGLGKPASSSTTSPEASAPTGSEGKESIGNEPITREYLEKFGEEILSKAVSKAQSLFVADTCEALASAKACVSTFNDQPPTVKLILVDMAYTLGKNGLSKFKRMITACNNGNYIKMSDELRDSHYYHQCKNRGKHHADKLLGIGKI